MTNEIIQSPFGAVATQDTAGARQSQSREIAETQTKYLMAERFPRDEPACSLSIVRSFDRYGLAEKAQYQYKRGTEMIVGPTIRAAEAMAQKWGNLDFGFRELSRGVGPDAIPFSEVESFAVDLQTRTRRSVSFIVRHWRDTKQGGYRLKDERDIYEMMSNQASRRTRACILALIPGDIVESAMRQAEVTVKANVDCSPAAVVKMLDAFEKMGVGKAAIEASLQRKIEPGASIDPGHMVRLRRSYASILEGVASPEELFDIAAKASGADAVNAAAPAKPKAQKPKPDQSTGEVPAPPPPSSYAEWVEKIKLTASLEIAQFVIDQAADDGLPSDQMADLIKFATEHFSTPKA